MSNVAPWSDERWEGISAHDHAKLHTGHVYSMYNQRHDASYHSIDIENMLT